MDDVMATIDVTASSSAISAEHLAWAEERLGPKPGKWDGYDAITDDDTRRDLWSKVGYVHGLSAEAGRNVVAIGQTLLEMKEMLPHGQFMACVKAEFGWDHSWAGHLMSVGARFSNYDSSHTLPSSAKVLSLLARSGADDATVQQAAEEGWTVAETKRRVAKPHCPREPQPTEALALNLLRKGADELERMRQALDLAGRARYVTADQVMAEQRLRQLPKGAVIHGADADFHRMKDGTWARLPHEGMVDVTPIQVEQPPEPQPQEQQTLIPEPVAPHEGVILSRAEAASLLGINPGSLSTQVSLAKRQGRQATIKGRLVETVGRGMFRVI